jgi:uncharacterized protein YneF (UPF0154 family)
MIIPFIIIVLAGICYLGFNFTYNSSSNELMEQQLKAAHYQSKLVASMIFEELGDGVSEEQIVNNIQQALEKSPSDLVFLCMFNKYGKVICHPDRKKIGMVIKNQDFIQSFSDIDLEVDFKSALENSMDYGGVRKIKGSTEIIYLSPVENTDWIITSHSNLTTLEDTLSDIKTKLQLFFILMWVCSVVLILFLVNVLYRKYFNKVTQENSEIQHQMIEKQTDGEYSNIAQEQDTNRPIKRFLAERGLKLVPVEVENIAFVYLENKVTYVVDLNGYKLTLNLNLEEVYQTLPKEQFFRVSRQIILSLKAIQNVEKYGVTQLRAVTHPPSEIPLIISKSKVSEFKLWMGK